MLSVLFLDRHSSVLFQTYRYVCITDCRPKVPCLFQSVCGSEYDCHTLHVTLFTWGNLHETLFEWWNRFLLLFSSAWCPLILDKWCISLFLVREMLSSSLQYELAVYGNRGSGDGVVATDLYPSIPHAYVYTSTYVYDISWTDHSKVIVPKLKTLLDWRILELQWPSWSYLLVKPVWTPGMHGLLTFSWGIWFISVLAFRQVCTGVSGNGVAL